jgi:hypothetical protein
MVGSPCIITCMIEYDVEHRMHVVHDGPREAPPLLTPTAVAAAPWLGIDDVAWPVRVRFVQSGHGVDAYRLGHGRTIR